MKTVQLGDQGAEVLRLRELLACSGFSSGSGDVFDLSLQEAVKDFQQQSGIEITGIVSYYTWEALLLGGCLASENLTETDFERFSELLDCEVTVLKALVQLETGGYGGFVSPGYPVILFEAPVFWRQLQLRGISPEQYLSGNEDILFPEWDDMHYKAGLAEYDRLEKARKIHREAADASASWGMFKIMGYDYPLCGCRSMDEFVTMMCESDLRQFQLGARYLKMNDLLPYLRKKDWTGFSRHYRGEDALLWQYDRKLEEMYKEMRENNNV